MLLEQQRKTSEETNASRSLSTLTLLLIYGKKKWYRDSSSQSRDRGTDREDKHVEIKAGRWVGLTGRLGLIYTHY